MNRPDLPPTPADWHGDAQRFAVRIKDIITELCDRLSPGTSWPVGSVYTTTKSRNPAQLFGGAWTELPGDGVNHVWERVK